MKTLKILPIIVLLMCLTSPVCHAWWWSPTAIVVDNDTGQPIEGVAAVAQWTQTGDLAWFEGGGTKLKKFKEAMSDRQGQIYIGGYWGIYIFSDKPTLTVYKPGYVAWNSAQDILEGRIKRTDFNSDNRIIRLQKFDKAYPEWQKKTNDAKYPHNFHTAFFGDCFMISGLNILSTKIGKIFDQHEKPYRLKENVESNADYLKKLNKATK
jgi:hypothetical protein